MNVWITDLIDEYLKTREAEDGKRDNTYFHPSEFYGCKRKMVYKYYHAIGVVQVDQEALHMNPRVQRIFDNGHYMHFRFGSYLSDHRCGGDILKGRWKCKNVYAHQKAKIYGKKEPLGITKPKTKCECGCDDYEYMEVSFFDKDYLIGGQVDAIVIMEDQDVVIDYKSIGLNGFKKLFNKPKPAHCVQMQCYLYLSGLKLGKFLYECKDNQHMKEIDVARNDQVIDEIVSDSKKLKEIINYVKSNGKRLITPRSNSLNPKEEKIKYGTKTEEYTKKSYECLDCPFRSHCWG